MKSRSYIILLVALASGIIQGSCEKSDTSSSPEVETYIELLRSNRYDSLDLPSFTHKDIPALLKYRNETQVITNFPNNPISSLIVPECSLGIYVLWTIESIRVVSIDSKPRWLRYPSLNPILSTQDSNEPELTQTQEVQDIAARAYYDWFYTNLYWEQFKWKDPLEGTNLQWR